MNGNRASGAVVRLLALRLALLLLRRRRRLGRVRLALHVAWVALAITMRHFVRVCLLCYCAVWERMVSRVG